MAALIEDAPPAVLIPYVYRGRTLRLDGNARFKLDCLLPLFLNLHNELCRHDHQIQLNSFGPRSDPSMVFVPD